MCVGQTPGPSGAQALLVLVTLHFLSCGHWAMVSGKAEVLGMLALFSWTALLPVRPTHFSLLKRRTKT